MEANRENRRRAVLDRRAFVKGAAVGALPLVYPPLASTARTEEPHSGSRPEKAARLPGVVIRQKNPDNLEFPFSTLDSFLTPNEQFYVRTHFEVPELDPQSWRLKVEGAVERPCEIGYDDLRRMPARTLTALLECSGNSRVFLKPPQLGIRWELGGVSNAEWVGVRLADVLERVGVRAGAVEVILEGADKGELKSPNPASPGVIPYARSLPLKKARRPEVLLAYRMNGKELPAVHGAPVRALVAGWYGMASVKWLKRIVVTDRPYQGYFQTFMYTVWDRSDGQPTLVPVGEMRVKSEIARPAAEEVVAANSRYRVHGAAWAGESEVQRVEVSTDSGKTWAEAKILDKAAPYTWRLWEYVWQTPERAGRRILMARATDADGRTQPMKRDDDLRDAMITHVLPVAVEVR
jgi:DMSO/TMAO reductase YedYZ molybdopterin-dependent catalytic subunit